MDIRDAKKRLSFCSAGNSRRVSSLFCAAMLILPLAGCNPTAGATQYEVVYPSGYSRDCYTYDDICPIEGGSYYLQWEEADDYSKTYHYDMRILDEDESVLYEYPDMGSRTMRGIQQDADTIWVCAERWTVPHHNGYLEDWLKESDLFLMDLRDGGILFQAKAGENEFYLTTKETRCYFYTQGEEEREMLFGLVKIPSKHAEIYYRDISDWTEKHTVYTFDYVTEPDIDTSKGVLTCIKFYVSEKQIKVAWTSYESIGNGDWEYLEKKAYDISYDIDGESQGDSAKGSGEPVEWNEPVPIILVHRGSFT